MDAKGFLETVGVTFRVMMCGEKEVLYCIIKIESINIQVFIQVYILIYNNLMLYFGFQQFARVFGKTTYS